MPHTYEYPRPSLTVDVVVVTQEEEPRVLLVQRRHDPFAGAWAFPGGFVNENEPLDKAARRELKEETELEVEEIEQLAAFGDPGRDIRGWTVTIAYLARIKDPAKVAAADDAADVGWFLMTAPPRLAFDHAQILEVAKRRVSRE